MKRRSFLQAGGAGALSLLLGRAPVRAAQDRPNIVWILAEDMSCHFGYQGERTIATPNVDRLAREGTVFEAAHVTCPVCSPSRSALITGMYQTTIGAHNHRSFRGTLKNDLTPPVRPVPELFREAGYHVCNGANPSADALGKTDYNFTYSGALYDGKDYTGRAPGQPFFMQFQLHGGKKRNAKVPNPVSPDAVTLPECRALSVLHYGDYDNVDAAWLTLGREVKARGLRPAGPPRVLCIVAPYTGREIDTQRYCSRLVLPVEE